MSMLRMLLVAGGLLALSSGSLSAQAMKVTCKDGTKSAGGQGACSSHGGVDAKAMMKANGKIAKSDAKADAKLAKAATKSDAKADAKMAKATAKPDAKAEAKAMKP